MGLRSHTAKITYIARSSLSQIFDHDVIVPRYISSVILYLHVRPGFHGQLFFGEDYLSKKL